MLGWLGALKDFPEKQDPGMCLLRGKPPPQKKQKQKKTKKTNKKQKKTLGANFVLCVGQLFYAADKIKTKIGLGSRSPCPL